MAKSLKSSYVNPAAASAAAIKYSAPDLTRHPPRSPRTRLGGYVHFPRLLDKARAVAAGRGGEFHYNCPFDQQFFAFTGINHKAFMTQVKSGKTDSQLLAFVRSKGRKRTNSEIVAWSAWMETWTPTLPDVRAFFNDVHRKNAAHRDDIATWFDWIELDDYVTYGGKP
jgi:hypothetical protein